MASTFPKRGHYQWGPVALCHLFSGGRSSFTGSDNLVQSLAECDLADLH